LKTLPAAATQVEFAIASTTAPATFLPLLSK